MDRLAGEIQASYPGGAIDRRDGLHIRWRADGMWLHVRPSGTEPIVRLIAEGPASDESRVRELIEASKEIINPRS